MPKKVNLIDSTYKGSPESGLWTVPWSTEGHVFDYKYVQSSVNPGYEIDKSSQPFEWTRYNMEKHNKSIFVIDQDYTSFRDYPANIEEGNDPSIDDWYVSADVAHACEKVLWLTESRSIYSDPSFIDDVIAMEDTFDYVLTHEQELLDRGAKYLKVPLIQYFLQDSNITDFTKTKNLSMIQSGRVQDTCPGHALRESIRINFEARYDRYGTREDSTRVDCVSEAYKDYRFAIVVENNKQPNYFTEKLLDCLACKTIPLYYGATPENYGFDANGILSFTTIEELASIVDNLSEELYNSKLDAVEANYELTRGKFKTVETFIHTEYPFLFD